MYERKRQKIVISRSDFSMPFNRKLLYVSYMYTVLSRQLSFGKIVRGFSAKCSGIVAQKLSQLQGLHGIT